MNSIFGGTILTLSNPVCGHLILQDFIEQAQHNGLNHGHFMQWLMVCKKVGHSIDHRNSTLVSVG